MGAGIVASADRFEREWAIPLGTGTNQQAELLAVGEALRKLRDRGDAEVQVFCDSEYAIGCLTRNWRIQANVELINTVRGLIRECRLFEMRKVTGHAGVAKNERADELARRAAMTGEYYASAPEPGDGSGA
jgi:ribonuclease HI